MGVTPMYYTPGPKGGMRTRPTEDPKAKSDPGGRGGARSQSHLQRSAAMHALEGCDPWLDHEQMDAIRAFLLACGPSMAWAEHAVEQPIVGLICALFSIGNRVHRVKEFFESNTATETFVAALAHPKTVELGLLHSELRQSWDEKTPKRSLETVTPLLQALAGVGVGANLFALYDAGYVSAIHAIRRPDGRRDERELSELLDGHNPLAIYPDPAAELVRRLAPVFTRNAAAITKADLRVALRAYLDRDD